MQRPAQDKYLRRYAEPESRLAAAPRRYDHVLVVPAFDEAPGFVAGLEAALAAGAPSLAILVVNAAEDAGAAALSRTEALLAALRRDAKELAPGLVWLDRGGRGDRVVIDRATPERRLPRKQGVGLARKIGCDLALAWMQRGAVASPWIHTTDADAELPSDYFAAARALSGRREVAALSYPFWHRSDGASERGRALSLYELSLRYYVLGLAWASSPYAFHTVGSTMAVRGDAYRTVRGIPKRQAGEDFYLLNKIAKLGAVVRPASSPILLSDRSSTRTPFGTGSATERLAAELRAGRDATVYHPAVFSLLRDWLAELEAQVESPSDRALGAELAPPLRRALERLGAPEALRQARKKTRSAEALAARLRGWFDGFRTLRLIHELRAEGFENQGWRQAFAAAPFAPDPAEDDLDALRSAAAAREIAALSGSAVWNQDRRR